MMHIHIMHIHIIHMKTIKEKRDHDFEREKGRCMGGFEERKWKGELCYNLKRKRAESKKASIGS